MPDLITSAALGKDTWSGGMTSSSFSGFLPSILAILASLLT